MIVFEVFVSSRWKRQTFELLDAITKGDIRDEVYRTSDRAKGVMFIV